MLERNQASDAGLPNRYARRETLLRSARIKINGQLKSKKTAGAEPIADLRLPIADFRLASFATG